MININKALEIIGVGENFLEIANSTRQQMGVREIKIFCTSMETAERTDNLLNKKKKRSLPCMLQARS